MLVVLYYIDSNTFKSPIKEDIESIKSINSKAKIKAWIDFVAEKDGKAASIITKNIRGYHFSEIRIKISKNLYRVLYCVWKNEYMVLLHLFSKKEGEKTPTKELNKAESRYNDFLKNLNLYF